MWCSTCQQDVPGISSREQPGLLCCARCGKSAYDHGQFNEGEQVHASTDPVTAWDEEDMLCWNNQPASDLPDEWSLQDDIRSAQRLHRNLCTSWPTGDSAGGNATNDVVQRIEPTPLITAPMAEPMEEKATKFFSWVAVYLGLSALVCGAGLSAWAYLGGHGQWLFVGVPTAVLGQIGLMVGLILQLDGLWQSHQRSSQSYTMLDHRLSDLRQTTTMFRPAHPQAFPAPQFSQVSPAQPPLDMRREIERLSARVSKGR